MCWMHIVFLMKKSQGECNTQPQTGAESELPQEGPFWCATLTFSLAPSGSPMKMFEGATAHTVVVLWLWVYAFSSWLVCKNKQPEAELIQRIMSHSFPVSKHSAWLS